jgi:hypothetical protein
VGHLQAAVCGHRAHVDAARNDLPQPLDRPVKPHELEAAGHQREPCHNPPDSEREPRPARRRQRQSTHQCQVKGEESAGQCPARPVAGRLEPGDFQLPQQHHHKRCDEKAKTAALPGLFPKGSHLRASEKQGAKHHAGQRDRPGRQRQPQTGGCAWVGDCPPAESVPAVAGGSWIGGVPESRAAERQGGWPEARTWLGIPGAHKPHRRKHDGGG